MADMEELRRRALESMRKRKQPTKQNGTVPQEKEEGEIEEGEIPPSTSTTVVHAETNYASVEMDLTDDSGMKKDEPPRTPPPILQPATKSTNTATSASEIATTSVSTSNNNPSSNNNIGNTKRSPLGSRKELATTSSSDMELDFDVLLQQYTADKQRTSPQQKHKGRDRRDNYDRDQDRDRRYRDRDRKRHPAENGSTSHSDDRRLGDYGSQYRPIYLESPAPPPPPQPPLPSSLPQTQTLSHLPSGPPLYPQFSMSTSFTSSSLQRLSDDRRQATVNRSLRPPGQRYHEQSAPTHSLLVHPPYDPDAFKIHDLPTEDTYDRYPLSSSQPHYQQLHQQQLYYQQLQSPSQQLSPASYSSSATPSPQFSGGLLPTPSSVPTQSYSHAPATAPLFPTPSPESLNTSSPVSSSPSSESPAPPKLTKSQRKAQRRREATAGTPIINKLKAKKISKNANNNTTSNPNNNDSTNQNSKISTDVDNTVSSDNTKRGTRTNNAPLSSNTSNAIAQVLTKSRASSLNTAVVTTVRASSPPVAPLPPSSRNSINARASPPSTAAQPSNPLIIHAEDLLDSDDDQDPAGSANTTPLATSTTRLTSSIPTLKPTRSSTATDEDSRRKTIEALKQLIARKEKSKKELKRKDPAPTTASSELPTSTSEEPTSSTTSSPSETQSKRHKATPHADLNNNTDNLNNDNDTNNDSMNQISSASTSYDDTPVSVSTGVTDYSINNNNNRVAALTGMIAQHEGLVSERERDLAENDTQRTKLKHQLEVARNKQYNIDVRLRVLQEQLRVLAMTAQETASEISGLNERFGSLDQEFHAKQQEVLNLKSQLEKFHIQLLEAKIEQDVQQQLENEVADFINAAKNNVLNNNSSNNTNGDAITAGTDNANINADAPSETTHSLPARPSDTEEEALRRLREAAKKSLEIHSGTQQQQQQHEKGAVTTVPKNPEPTKEQLEKQMRARARRQRKAERKRLLKQQQELQPPPAQQQQQLEPAAQVVQQQDQQQDQQQVQRTPAPAAQFPTPSPTASPEISSPSLVATTPTTPSAVTTGTPSTDTTSSMRTPRPSDLIQQKLKEARQQTTDNVATAATAAGLSSKLNTNNNNSSSVAMNAKIIDTTAKLANQLEKMKQLLAEKEKQRQQRGSTPPPTTTPSSATTTTTPTATASTSTTATPAVSAGTTLATKTTTVPAVKSSVKLTQTSVQPKVTSQKQQPSPNRTLSKSKQSVVPSSSSSTTPITAATTTTPTLPPKEQQQRALFLHCLGIHDSSESTSSPSSPSAGLTDVPSVLWFRSFRLSPLFCSSSSHTTNKATLALSHLSPTFSHSIHPFHSVCPYDLHGVCNDTQCKFQHTRDFIWGNDEGKLLRDLAAYFPVSNSPAQSAYIAKLCELRDTPTEHKVRTLLLSLYAATPASLRTETTSPLPVTSERNDYILLEPRAEKDLRLEAANMAAADNDVVMTTVVSRGNNKRDDGKRKRKNWKSPDWNTNKVNQEDEEKDERERRRIQKEKEKERRKTEEQEHGTIYLPSDGDDDEGEEDEEEEEDVVVLGEKPKRQKVVISIDSDDDVEDGDSTRYWLSDEPQPLQLQPHQSQLQQPQQQEQQQEPQQRQQQQQESIPGAPSAGITHKDGVPPSHTIYAVPRVFPRLSPPADSLPLFISRILELDEQDVEAWIHIAFSEISDISCFTSPSPSSPLTPACSISRDQISHVQKALAHTLKLNRSTPTKTTQQNNKTLLKTFFKIMKKH